MIKKVCKIVVENLYTVLCKHMFVGKKERKDVYVFTCGCKMRC